MGARVNDRNRWARSDVGQARMRDIVDYATAQHNEVARKHPELGLDQHGRINMSPAQLYDHYGFEQENRGPGMGEQQIPGLEDPDALPQPKRWEDHTPQERERIQRSVKLRTGVDLDFMTKAFGAQLDQGYTRALGHGADKPYAADFYTSGPEAEKLHSDTRALGTRFGVVAAVNADTSPNMKFRHQYKEGHPRAGEVVYPNADAARGAIEHIQNGGSPFADPNEVKAQMPSYARGVRPANLAKGMRRANEAIVHGIPIGRTRVSQTEATSGFGPKTSAYHNSWLVGTPDFAVSDIHTGGGGMLPHLGTAKPQAFDKEGNAKWATVHTESGSKTVPYRDKSEREKGVTIPGFHAMSDFAVRQAMAQRGLGHVRQAQAVQWGEEQLQRGEAGERANQPDFQQPKNHLRRIDPKDASRFPTEHEVYPPKPPPVNLEQFGQQRLF